MDEEISLEDIAYPAIESYVVMGTDYIRTVVDGFSMLLIASRWLQADEDVPIDHPRHRHLSLHDMKCPWGFSPRGDQALLYLWSECIEPSFIKLRGNTIHSTSYHLLRIQPRVIIRHRTDNLPNDIISISIMVR